MPRTTARGVGGSSRTLTVGMVGQAWEGSKLTGSVRRRKPTPSSALRSSTVLDLLSRREFLTSAAVGATAASARHIPYPMRPPRALPPAARWAAKPVVISSANGLRAVQKAFEMLMQGADTLDAVIEGVKIQELDPNDDSVGYGGVSNAPGVGQLFAPRIHDPTQRRAAEWGV